MSDSINSIGSWCKSDMANFANTKNMKKNSLMTSGFKYVGHLPLKPIMAVKDWKIGKGTGCEAALFLLKIIVLEGVRRFSNDRCPFVWTGLQALQVLCYPPLKLIQRWNPFGIVIKGMQTLSLPMLVLSVVNAFSDHPDCSNFVSDDADNSHVDRDSQLSQESHSGPQPFESNHVMGTSNENHQIVQPTNWKNHLSEELDNLGITLPERITTQELERFYVAANGDLPTFLSSVKKTIRWRETYIILSVDELKMWSNMIFWHGLDVKDRPCLIIRLGMACTSLLSQDKPCFVQAVVSQVEHGVLHLVDGENPQITVLVDCFGLSPLRFPMKKLRYCCNLLEDHYPNVLGCLIVVRLPPLVRVIAQTFIQVLKPVTKQKLRIEGDAYKKTLLDCFHTLPSYLGGQCTCTKCSRLDSGTTMQDISDNRSIASAESATGFANDEDLLVEQPTREYDMIMDGNCSRTLRSAVIGILIIWVFFAFIQGIYNMESHPVLPI